MGIAKRLHHEVLEERTTLERAERILHLLFGQKKREQQQFQFTEDTKENNMETSLIEVKTVVTTIMYGMGAVAVLIWLVAVGLAGYHYLKEVCT